MNYVRLNTDEAQIARNTLREAARAYAQRPQYSPAVAERLHELADNITAQLAALDVDAGPRQPRLGIAARDEASDYDTGTPEALEEPRTL